jgi:hypothetical protein
VELGTDEAGMLQRHETALAPLQIRRSASGRELLMRWLASGRRIVALIADHDHGRKGSLG